MVLLDHTPIQLLEQWKTSVASEVRAAKQFNSNWGFLKERPETTGGIKVPQASMSVKYFDKGGYSVMAKRVSLKGKAATDALAQYKANQAMLKSVNSIGTRPSTALEASFLNHSESLEALGRGKVEYMTSSSRYGRRRHALEQFGICEYGIETTRSRLPSC